MLLKLFTKTVTVLRFYVKTVASYIHFLSMMKINFKFFFFLFILFSFRGYSQDTPTVSRDENYYDMSLEELMNIKISVASVKELTPRESPGIVTLITADDIKNFGARDLTDVLRMVPGFDFGTDVEGIVGIGVRGNWAHEGKILLLIDGQQMNENLYSTIQLGNHYPVENIQRIEIIRGPGSAVYGDCAEYAVINIITKKAKDIQGGGISAFYGQTNKGLAHRKTNIFLGEEQKDFSYTFSGYLSESNRSTEIYTDVYGNSYDMSDQSQIKTANINLGLNIKDYQFRGIIDNYTLNTRDAYQQILSKAYTMSFDSYFFELKKDYRINSKLSLTPKFNYKSQTPWAFDNASEQDEFERYKVNSQQYSGSLTASYDFNPRLNLITGTEYIHNIAIQKAGSVFYTTSTDRLGYENASVFAQTLFKTRVATFAAGARYNYNSRYDASFVPRFGITKALNKFHFKLLFSKAFRAPNTENIDLNPLIKPENTRVFEAETGYEISPSMFITVNAFDIVTKDPIIYYYDALYNDGYTNLERTGTRGSEVEYKYKSSGGYAGVNYSFYVPSGTVLRNYAVPVNPDALLGFATHKINLTSGIKISNHIKLNASVSFSGPRYGIVGLDEITGDTIVNKFKPVVIANLNISYDDLFFKGMSASFGVYNLFDSEEFYIQPYNSLHAPLPGYAREFALKISYNLHFNQP
ncbi:MAG: TonB-dependent receptor plug domain-containing protein [Bacteroidia bacterium]